MDLKQQFHHWQTMTQQIEQDFKSITQQREAKTKEAMLKNAISKEQHAQKVSQIMENKKKEAARINEEKEILTKELIERQKQLRDVNERIMAEIKANELGLKKLSIQNTEPN